MAQWINWGDGRNGSPNSISGVINTYATVTASSGSKTVTTSLSVTIGDQVLLHQTQHPSLAGTWEIVKVASNGSGNFTTVNDLINSYYSGAQAVRIPQYTGGNISGSVTASSWNGSTGGIVALISNGGLTISGTLSVVGLGFRGGESRTSSTAAYSGEGTIGPSVKINTANGNGGGGGAAGDTASGGGGGHVTTPSRSGSKFGNKGGYGGGTAGNESLTKMVFGGGGGGGSAPSTHEDWGQTSPGGGIIFIIAKSLTVSGNVNTEGVRAKKTVIENGVWWCSTGAGAAGSCLIKCQTATLGTNKVTSLGGAKSDQGSAGSVGRIHIDYGKSYSGVTNPEINATKDSSLITGGNFIPFFM